MVDTMKPKIEEQEMDKKALMKVAYDQQGKMTVDMANIAAEKEAKKQLDQETKALVERALNALDGDLSMEEAVNQALKNLELQNLDEETKTKATKAVTTLIREKRAA